MHVLRKWFRPIGYWGAWAAAVAAGFYAGAIVNLVLRPLLVLGRVDLEWPANDLQDAYMNLDLAGFIFLALLSGMITGAVVGLFQWLVLRRKADGYKMWLPATAIAFGIDYLLKTIFFLVDTVERSGSRLPTPRGSLLPILFVITPLLGALIIGFSQWLVLRRRVKHSGWWMLALPIATVVSLQYQPYGIYDNLIAGIMSLASTLPIGVISLTKIAYAVPYLFEGLIVGVLSGAVIVMLLGQARILKKPTNVEDIKHSKQDQ